MNFPTEISGPPLTEIFPDSWIFDRVEEWARRTPGRIAFTMEHADGGVLEYSYPNVLDQIRWIAASLAARGIQSGDRVGILMENIPQWVFVLLGTLRLGAIAVPLATTLPDTAIRNLLKHSGCRIIFADSPNLSEACAAGEALGALVVAWQGEDPRSIPWSAFEVRNSDVPFQSALADPIALIVYTSGTTGDPKGVQLSIQNLIHEIRGISEAMNIADDHRILSVLPFSHVLPLIANALGPLCIGSGVVFLSSISPQRIIEAFHRHRITCFVCVPQFFYALHKRIFSEVALQPWIARKVFHGMLALSRRIRYRNLSRRMFARVHHKLGPALRVLASGGSRFDKGIAEDFNALGYVMLNAYGLTESCAAVTATPSHGNTEGTVGKPIRGVSIQIDLPSREGVGEIAIRGPIVMKGYYRDPKHTAEAICDGWLLTGDLGFIGKDGNLVVTGRSKEVIVLANGENIYPEEIEVHYAQSSLIKEICILGVRGSSDEPDGEKLHAIVVPDLDEFRRRGLTTILESVQFDVENLSRQLPSYQRVLSLSIRNEPFPRTVTRKLKRFEIQAEETARRRPHPRDIKGEDHPRFRSGAGAEVAALIRKTKPNVGVLDPALNIELDLGLDSLARVELLGELEIRLGVHVEEAEASRIYTLGELVDALENPNSHATSRRQGWKARLAGTEADKRHKIFAAKPLSKLALILTARTVRLLGKLLFDLKWSGLERLPTPPYLLCPNHESFLDAPMLFATLPSAVVTNIFSLGYSDYWKSGLSRWIAEHLDIVALDSSEHLVHGMQIAAAGLRGQKILLVFPEGTRSIDGHLAYFKKGAAILAYELGVPVVPVGINGTFEAWPRVGPFRLHPIKVIFGNPIHPQEFAASPDPHAALTDRLRNDVKLLTVGS